MANSWFETDWFIEDVLPAWNYRIRVVDTDFIVMAVKSWRMRKNRITLIAWDRIRMDVNEYDNTKGRITFRYKTRDWSDSAPWEKKESVWWDKKNPTWWGKKAWNSKWNIKRKQQQKRWKSK